MKPLTPAGRIHNKQKPDPRPSDQPRELKYYHGKTVSNTPKITQVEDNIKNEYTRLTHSLSNITDIPHYKSVYTKDPHPLLEVSLE